MLTFLYTIGNLHLNITAKEYDENVTKLIEPYIYEWTGESVESYNYNSCTSNKCCFIFSREVPRLDISR